MSQVGRVRFTIGGAPCTRSTMEPLFDNRWSGKKHATHAGLVTPWSAVGRRDMVQWAEDHATPTARRTRCHVAPPAHHTRRTVVRRRPPARARCRTHLASEVSKRRTAFHAEARRRGELLLAERSVRRSQKQTLWGCGWRGILHGRIDLDPEGSSPRLRASACNALARQSSA
jgi:hypothetical protein